MAAAPVNIRFLASIIANMYLNIRRISLAPLPPRIALHALRRQRQEDARIYREVARRHPGRIWATYLRDVQIPERAVLVTPISAELQAQGVPMLRRSMRR